jgi:GH15 family glucan-1,4-alpha-glucosidase
MCVPRFDGSPLFGRLIDSNHGGSFAISPRELQQHRRCYISDSATLETTWVTSGGEARLTEAMVVEVTGALLPSTIVVRHLKCIRGTVDLTVEFDPRLGLPGRRPHVSRRNDSLLCEWGSLAVAFTCGADIEIRAHEPAVLSLTRGDGVTFVLTVADREPMVFVEPQYAMRLLDDTTSSWQTWTADLGYHELGDAVVRSLITLRLLTYSPSGAPVAAPTTSLPEHVGGRRNWDYRYSWPRDAAIGLSAFLAAGDQRAAHAYTHWLLHASRLTRPRLSVVYTVDGNPAPKEQEVTDVSGYRDSLPVRVGNAAGEQHQLDVYGWVLDAAWSLERAGHPLHDETWRALAGAVDFVARHWEEPDAGIWEVRGDRSHYVHSKLMAWLAIDRGLAIGERHRVTAARLKRWRTQRDRVAEQVRDLGVDASRNCYTWRYGDQQPDAALLLLPTLEFDPPESLRVDATIATIRQQLEVSPGLLYRYPPEADGLHGPEGAFLPCSFWLVQALAKTGQIEEAVGLFKCLMSYSNDVGLYGEEIDPKTKEQLGNFPQALTHAAVIQAARSIRAAAERPTRSK